MYVCMCVCVNVCLPGRAHEQYARRGSRNYSTQSVNSNWLQVLVNSFGSILVGNQGIFIVRLQKMAKSELLLNRCS